ncbi:Sugar phosphate isomerase/epimerase [Paenibacillus sp. UNC496MF]|uniref:sugar phosphate isomerase/epimerase family protein n=1 Tax=Paenibacillus sp. UNC496MF TaxID=1502753 RepID=UPI0008E7D9D6|nr:sugar phosphate isomerase/epimerase [Paenibacillus sp. UNC496MF]SFI42125.1 Sugar phosphate isomerase/epimerase [Paenibacillus sp. UNC496MF]
MSIKYAFSRPTATDDDRDLLFNSYRSVGYDGLQLKHGQYASYMAEPERFLEKWGSLPGAGSALITGGTLDEDGRGQLEKLFAFAERIGTRTIVYCHGVSRKNVTIPDIRRYADILSELGKSARQRGIALSLHHHYDQPVMYREDFDVFFERIKEREVGLTVDTAHLVKSGITDAAEVITSFGPFIDNFHLKDFDGGEWRVLGQGAIDFAPIFKAIGDIRYSGWVSADEESGGGIAEGMQACLAFMRDGLEARHDRAIGR